MRLFSRWLLTILISGSALSAQGQGTPASPELMPTTGKETFLFEFTHPQTKEKMKVFAPETPSARLRQFSPKNWKKRAPAMKCDGISMIDELIEEVPIETIGFSLFTVIQASIMAGGDPAALKHIYEQNVADPSAHLSIVAFVLAHQGTDQFFKMMGWVFNPCKPRAKNFTSASYARTGPLAVQGATPTRFQRVFGRLAPGFGMGVGMGVSSFVQDLWKDKNLHTCVMALISPMDPAKKEEACEQAYETWTVGRKLNQYLPDMVSMVSAYFISAYVAMPAAQMVGRAVGTGVRRFVPVIWRGLSIAWRASYFATPFAVKWMLQIGNLIVMAPIQSFLMPPMKSFWVTWTHGEDINKSAVLLRSELDRAEKNGWKWKPIPKICIHTPTDAMGMPTGATESYDCFEDTPDLPKLIKKYGKRNEEWRKFLLQGPLEAHKQWQDYVLKFQNTYTAAYNFNKWFVAEVAFNKTSGRTSDLFKQQPLKGVAVTFKNEKGKDVSAGESSTPIAVLQALKFIDELMGDSSARLRLNDRASLRRIRTGLALAIESNPLPGADNPNSEVSKVLNSYPPEQRGTIAERMRTAEIDKAIGVLHHTLETDPLWGTKYVPYPSPMYERMAETNPFAALRMILGNPRPAPEGMEALRWVDTQEEIIMQDLKKNHPFGIGSRATTGTMSDYLLGMMVCGPEANPSRRLKLLEQRRRSTGWWARKWRDLVGNGVNENVALNSAELAELEKVAEDAKAPGERLFDPNRKLSLIRETWLISAKFNPPRLIPDFGIDFCNTKPRGVNPDKAGYSIHEGVWTLRGKSYAGFLGLAKHNLRSEILSTDGKDNRFESWWSEKVDSTVRKVADAFFLRFQNVLDEGFYPALTGEKFDAKLVEKKSSWDRLSWRYTNGPVRAGNHMNKKFEGGALELGVKPSMLAQAKYYLELVERIRSALVNKGPTLNTVEFKKRQDLILTYLDLMTALFDRPRNAFRAIEETERLLKIKPTADLEQLSYQQMSRRIDDTHKALEKAYKDLLQEIENEALRSLKKIALDAKLAEMKKQLAEERVKALANPPVKPPPRSVVFKRTEEEKKAEKEAEKEWADEAAKFQQLQNEKFDAIEKKLSKPNDQYAQYAEKKDVEEMIAAMPLEVGAKAPNTELSAEETKILAIRAALKTLERLTDEIKIYVGLMKTVYVAGLHRDPPAAAGSSDSVTDEDLKLADELGAQMGANLKAN